MRFLPFIVIIFLLFSCSVYDPPRLVKLSYEYMPAPSFGMPSTSSRPPESHELTEGIKAPEGLYNFLTDEELNTQFAVPDADHEMLVLEFNNGKKFSLLSCHRLFEFNQKLIATDYGIAVKSDVDKDSISNDFRRYKFMFNELIRLNNLGQR